MKKIKTPSGLEIGITDIYRKISKLTDRDFEFIYSNRRARFIKKIVGNLIGRFFARKYQARRYQATGKNIDWWSLHSGSFQKKFIEAAFQAKIHSIDFSNLISKAERFVRKKGFCSYPSPSLVCGTYIFSEALNDLVNQPMKINEIDKIVVVDDHGSATWNWQPGYKWDFELGMFCKK